MDPGAAKAAALAAAADIQAVELRLEKKSVRDAIASAVERGMMSIWFSSGLKPQTCAWLEAIGYVVTVKMVGGTAVLDVSWNHA